MGLKIRLLILSLVFTSLTASSQVMQSVLWEVSGRGLKDKSYLLGTVHTLSPSLLDKFSVKQYMRKAQFGVFEISGDPIIPAQPKTNGTLERPQPPLDSLFSKQDYALVDSIFSASPLGSIKAHNEDADLLGMLYAVRMLKQTSAAAETSGLDTGIAEEMRRTGKPLFRLDADDDPDRRALETSYTLLANLIVLSIKDKDSKADRAFKENMEAAYIAKLSADLKLNEEATGFMREITVRRNLLWYPQLEQKMKEGSCFVAVGLGHLQYKSGLITLLRQHGYKVKPVTLLKN
ncbi:TraB/GumN family protein [Hymenobacter crusticola]|uniref:TraB/GumN family protein n=1 Tax=Hymenobacter crusticola TaxID=1770526 RepID=A0A243WI53_9BACT|nr:TraB/GumN family protein [Hymenobacter crusticola]OUJ75489.1 hypothetical protein BXP70_05615 [Hymenobacter crusticola]